MTATITEHAKDLDNLEVIIGTNLQSFIAVGKALTEIRDRKLYRDQHKTFEAYCRARWDMSKTHANRLIGSSAVAEVLAPAGVIPQNERQIRPLALLETPEMQQKAWELAKESAGSGNLTAQIVGEAVKKVLSNGGDDERCPEEKAKSRHLDLLKKHWKEGKPSDREQFRRWIDESSETRDPDSKETITMVRKDHDENYTISELLMADVNEAGMHADTQNAA